MCPFLAFRGPHQRCLGRGCSLVCWRPRPSKIPEASSLRPAPLLSVGAQGTHTGELHACSRARCPSSQTFPKKPRQPLGHGGDRQRGVILQVPAPPPALCLLHPMRQHSRHPAACAALPLGPTGHVGLLWRKPWGGVSWDFSAWGPSSVCKALRPPATTS